MFSVARGFGSDLFKLHALNMRKGQFLKGISDNQKNDARQVKATAGHCGW